MRAGGFRATKKFLLIDGHSLLFRAFFAIPHLSNSKGVPTNALYGFVRMLFSLLKQHSPDALVVAFDAHGPTFRHAAFTEYKANREAMPDELSTQVQLAHEVLDALGVAHMEALGFEADDIIGTLSRRAELDGFQTLIVTGDNDALQLVSEKTTVVVNTRGVSEVVHYTPEKVEEKLGVPPDKVIDLKALQGDTSDNIPGVPGIGAKTAASLLQEFGSLQNLLERLSDVHRPAQRKALEEHREQVLRNRELVAIVRDMDLEARWSDWEWTFPSPQKLREVFEPFEFTGLVKECGDNDEPESSARVHWEVVDSPADLQKLLSAVRQAGEFAVCLDMGGNISALLQGVAIAWGDEKVAYLRGSMSPSNTAPETCNEPRSLFAEGSEDASLRTKSSTRTHSSTFTDAISQLFSNETLRWVAHDAKRFARALSQGGVVDPALAVRSLSGDVLIMAYLLNPAKQDHPIPELSAQYLGRPMSLPDDAAEAACVSARVILEVAPALKAELHARDLWTLYADIEHPLIETLSLMEIRGMPLDIDYLHTFSTRLTRDIASLEAEIHDLAGEPFNIGSTKQLQVILFEKLNLPRGRKTKTGYSTNAAVLDKLASDHEIVRKILDYRELTKLNSTYADGLLKLVHPATRRVHTSFRQTGSATGRLSSAEPNLQNIPIRTELGREIRRSFVAPEDGWVLLAADYSQIELRVLAHVTEDPRLVQAFQNDEDIHTRTAADIYQVQPEDVVSEMRRTAKVINFGIAYGMSSYGLGANLSLPPFEAQVIIDSYFATFPGVQRYMEEIVAQARRDGFVTTLLKRRRPIADINSPNRQAREFAERAAINSPIQGTAADIIKLAMVMLHRQLTAGAYRTRMLLQVHDELVFEVPLEELDAVVPLVRRSMESAYVLSVPLKVDVEVGPNWRDMERLPGRETG